MVNLVLDTKLGIRHNEGMAATVKLTGRKGLYTTDDGYIVECNEAFFSNRQVWIVSRGGVELGEAYGLKAARSMIARHRSAA